MKIKILIPLYNDWQSLLKLLENINHHVSDVDHIISIVVVNDGSTEKAPKSFPSYSKINSLKIINLKENVGHARSIATSLKFILENDDFDYIIPMDSDGEDRPEEIKDLIKKIEAQSDLPIVCERVKRSEGFLFKFCYFLHKLITFTFTGKSIRFGNFTCLPKEVVRSMTNEKGTWSSFSGSLAKTEKDRATVPSIRGSRYFGPTKMNFKSLVIHSLSIIGVFKISLILRSILFSLVYFFLISENISIITMLPIVLVIILVVLTLLISKRENMEEFKNSLSNIGNIINIK